MKKSVLAVALVLSSAAGGYASPASPESESLRGSEAFGAAGHSFEKLRSLLAPVLGLTGAGPVRTMVGSFVMKDRLDAHRGMLRRQLGRYTWDISMALSPGSEGYFLTLSRTGALKFLHIKEVQDLVGEGRTVDLGGGSVYRFRVEPDLFDPARGSTLFIEPVAGGGPSHSMKTGVLLDAIRDHSYRFSVEGLEYWTLYGTDLDPAAGAWAKTRSLLFFHEDGTQSRLWKVPEGDLPVDQAYGLGLSGATVALVKGKDGVLRIYYGK